MAIAEELLIVIDAKTSQAVKDLKKVTGSTNKLTDTLKKMAGPLAIGAVTLGLIKMGKESVRAFGVQEQAEAKLRQTIISTGEAAGLTADQLTDMATGLQQVTKFGDEAIIGAESLLLTFKDVGENVFPRALESILDVSEAMGTGLKESTIQVGKALNDPIQGLTALRRVGIQFSDAQEDLIKGFVASNELSKAQGIILEELESQFGGVARAAADTASGALTQARNAFGDLQEQLGQTIAEGMVPFAKATTEISQRLAKWIEANREVNNFLTEFEDGVIDSAVELDTLNDALILSEARLKQATDAGRGHTEGLAAEVAALKIAISQRARGAALEAQFADAKKEQDKDKAQALALEISNNAAKEESEKKLLQLQFEALSAEAQQIQLLQEEIDKYAVLRSQGADVQELLNFLVAQRNDLLKEEIDTTIVLSDAQALKNAEAEAGLNREIVLVEELNQTYLDLAKTGLGAFASAFEEVGAGNVTLWNGFKQAGKDAVSALLKSLAEMAIVQAAISAASFNFASAGLYTAAGVAAFAAAGKVQSFATGTSSFVANKPTAIVVGEGAQSENVEVTPIGGSGGGNESMILNIDGEQFIGWMQSQLDNRGLRVPRESVV